jgi:beta-N-acetylglucosaminidase
VANWNRWLEDLENDIRAQRHVVLKPGQYASDIDWANAVITHAASDVENQSGRGSALGE